MHDECTASCERPRICVDRAQREVHQQHHMSHVCRHKTIFRNVNRTRTLQTNRYGCNSGFFVVFDCAIRD